MSACPLSGQNHSCITCPQPDLSLRTRGHSVSREDWERVKSVCFSLYIERNCKLSEVIRILKEDHGFSASEQMFKKRLAAWGMSKIMTADQKDEALRAYLETLPTTETEGATSLPPKVLRYVRHKARNGDLNTSELPKELRGRRKTTKASNARPKERATSSDGSSTPETNSQTGSSEDSQVVTLVNASLSPPAHLADTDLLLRALRDLTITQNAAPSTSQWESYTSIRIALEVATNYWQCNAFVEGRRAFAKAGEVLLATLQQGDIPALSLIKEQGCSDWPTSCKDVWPQWRKYVASCAVSVLPRDHPFVLVTTYMHKLSCEDVESAMWDCMLDHLCLTDTATYSRDQWWEVALHQIVHFEESGRYELAREHCSKVEDDLRKHNAFDTEQELGLLQVLADVSCRENDMDAARKTLQQMISLTYAGNLEKSVWHLAEAMRGLALVEEKCDNIPEALKLREGGLINRARVYGYGDPQTVYTFTMLLQFCQRHGLHNDLNRLTNRYPELYSHLEESTEGLWSCQSDDDLTSNGFHSTFEQEFQSRPASRNPFLMRHLTQNAALTLR